MPEVKLTPKQTLAFRSLTSPHDLALLYGGAKGGAKSFLLCIWLKVWVEALITLFGLKPSTSPLAVGFVGRKRSIDFHDTTLEDFKRIIPASSYRLHDNEHEIIFHETAKVFCGGLDDPKRVEKFNSANYAFFAIDQAEETERHEIAVLKATLRLMIDGKQPPYKQLYTANPADCWLKEDFIDAALPHHLFIPALYTDNPHLPANYGETLDAAFRYNEAMLKAYKYGDWTALQAANVLITARMLALLKDTHIYPSVTRRLVSCDPSMGGDECVIQAIQNGAILEQLVLHERDTMKVAGQVVVMMNRHRTANAVIDTIGLGQGISDRVREVKPTAHVYALNSAAEATDPVHFANVRAEMWWHAMTEVQERRIPAVEDEELRKQLTAPRFKVVNSNGRIQLEPKEETKKRLGRSPDRADAFVMGLYGLPRTDPIRDPDAWREESASREVSSAVTSAMAA
jgi:hypothetical protein